MHTDIPDNITSVLAALALVCARYGPLVVCLPMGGKRIRLRIALFMALAIMLVPTLLLSANSIDISQINAIIPSELLLGCALGAVVNAVMQTLMIAGFYIGQVSGTSESVFQQRDGLTSHGQLVVLVTIASLFLTGLHREIIATLLQSYQWFPLGHVQQHPDWVATLVQSGSQILALSIRLAAPVLICAGASWIMIGWIGRVAPTFGDFISTMPLHIVLVLVGVLLSLGSISFVMQNEIQSMLTHFF